MDTHNIILNPIISEKSMADARNNVYTFSVAKNANKPAIKKALEEQFSVHVVSLATGVLKKGSLRKARAKLREGETIDLFEVGGNT